MYLKKILIALSLFFLTLFCLGKLLKLLPEGIYLPNKDLIQGCSKFALMLVVVIIIRKETIFNTSYFFKHKIGSMVASTLLICGALSTTFDQMKTYKVIVTDYNHYSYLFYSMSTGFLEEFLFRILIFGYVCQLLYNESRKTFYKEVIVTGLLFGIIHLLNLRVAASWYEVTGTINQVLFAGSLGIIFQSLFFRFNNIFLNAILHGLINYVGTRNSQIFGIAGPDDDMPVLQELMQSILFTAVVIVLLVIPIMYFCVKGRENKMIIYQVKSQVPIVET